MLTIITGMECTGKKILNDILSINNTFVYNGVTITIDVDSGNYTSDIEVDEEMFDVIYDKTLWLRELRKETLVGNRYLNIKHDLGLPLHAQSRSLVDRLNSDIEFKNTSKLDDLLKLYTEAGNSLTISGGISKSSIEIFQQKLGADNVKVFNIIRNPSVVYIMNYKDALYFNKSEANIKWVELERLVKSIQNALLLKDMPGVATIKYEDICANGAFAGVTLPESFTLVNDHIVKGESNNVHYQEGLAAWNEALQSFKTYDYYNNITLNQNNYQLDNFTPDERNQLLERLSTFSTDNGYTYYSTLEELSLKIHNKLPNNVLQALHYTP